MGVASGASNLNLLLEKRYSVYFSEQLVNGRVQASPFVHDSSHVVLVMLQSLNMYYRINCWKGKILSENVEENFQKYGATICGPLLAS